MPVRIGLTPWALTGAGATPVPTRAGVPGRGGASWASCCWVPILDGAGPAPVPFRRASSCRQIRSGLAPRALTGAGATDVPAGTGVPGRGDASWASCCRVPTLDGAGPALAPFTRASSCRQIRSGLAPRALTGDDVPAGTGVPGRGDASWASCCRVPTLDGAGPALAPFTRASSRWPVRIGLAPRALTGVGPTAIPAGAGVPGRGGAFGASCGHDILIRRELDQAFNRWAASSDLNILVECPTGQGVSWPTSLHPRRALSGLTRDRSRYYAPSVRVRDI